MKIFSKFLVIVSIFMSIALARVVFAEDAPNNVTELETTGSKKVDAQIIKFNDYYRFSFKSSDYLPFELLVDGGDIIIDFAEKNDLNLSNFIYNNSIIKSFGSSGDGKSYVIRLNVDGAKLRKFIADDNTTGFDLYASDKKAEKKIVIMSGLPDELAAQQSALANPGQIAESKSTDSKTAFNSYAKTQIITFPPEFIGPPKSEQLFKNKDTFVGPFAFDTNRYTVYEVTKTAAKGAIIPDITVDEKGMVLSFPLKDMESVSAGAIDIDNTITIVFNSVNSIQLGELLENPFIKSIKNVPNDTYKIIQIELNNKKIRGDAYTKAFYKDKFAWIFEVYKKGKTDKFEVTPINIGAENNFGEKRIIANSDEIVGPAVFENEKTGEKIKAFMVKDNGYGIISPREYVDVKFLPSLQGIFLTEKSDYITYEPSQKKLVITKLSNLQISDDIIASEAGDSKTSLLASSKIKGIYPDNSIFPFQLALAAKSLSKKDKKEDQQTTESKDKKDEKSEADGALDLASKDEEAEAELKLTIIEDDTENSDKKEDISVIAVGYSKQIISAPKEKQSDLKLQMANMYFSKGFYAEALGVLQDIKTSDPAYRELFTVNTLIAASNYFTGKYSESYDGFTEALLTADKDKNYSELKLWQWAAEDMYKLKTRNNNDSPVEIDFTASFDKFMQQYPLNLRYKMGLMYIEQKLKANNTEDASDLLDIISYNGVPKNYANETLFVKALIADKQSNSRLAVKIYEKLIKDTEDRKNRARAMFELTKNQLLKNEIDSKTAIEKFLTATTIWRDDYFEMDVLEIVGHLYVSLKDYNSALVSWKQIANNFPETSESVFILGKMRQLFTDLFDGGDAYKLKPLETLKLYFGFRELTPTGDVGDRITKKVAQFFISADMMDESIKIVEHQIKYRSFGDEKAKLALWLYKINLDNRDLDGAKSALDLINESETSPLLQKERYYAYATIEALRGNYQETLNLIKNDFSSEANKIRTELFWQKENWFGVINMVEARLNDIRETKPLPLTKPEMNDINRLLVAYSAQGENKKLVSIKEEFFNRIPDNYDQLLFDYLTAGNKSLDYNDFENSVELGQIEKFLNDYTFMPTQSWESSVKILEPKVAKLVGKLPDDMTRTDKLDIVKLAIAYSMLSLREDKEAIDTKKEMALLARDFKDIRIDRVTIDAFNIFDDKYMPKENDAVFEGKIKITDIPQFIEYYKRTNKFSELNISIRDVFEN